MSPRALHPDERHLLDVLLGEETAADPALREQAAHVEAVGPSCGCGCPSVLLAVDRALARPAAGRDMVADGVGLDADGADVGVLLFTDDDGYLTELEVYGSADRYGLPTRESFRVAEWIEVADGIRELRNAPGRER